MHIGGTIRSLLRRILLWLAAALEEQDQAAETRHEPLGQPPADWLERVRRGAPQLLRDSDEPFEARGTRPDTAPLRRTRGPAKPALRIVPPPRSPVLRDSGSSPEAALETPRNRPAEPARITPVSRIPSEAPVRLRATRVVIEEELVARKRRASNDEEPVAHRSRGAEVSPELSRPTSERVEDESVVHVSREVAEDPVRVAREREVVDDESFAHHAHEVVEDEPLAHPSPEVVEVQRASHQEVQRASQEVQRASHQRREDIEQSPVRSGKAGPAVGAAVDPSPPSRLRMRKQVRTLPVAEAALIEHPTIHWSDTPAQHAVPGNTSRTTTVAIESEFGGEPMEPAPNDRWPELPAHPPFGDGALAPIESLDDRERLRRLSVEQRGSGWSE